ncbi:hypothetical protein Hanom_Chr10g00953451 [Helianthus anomalus]
MNLGPCGFNVVAIFIQNQNLVRFFSFNIQFCCLFPPFQRRAKWSFNVLL